MALGVLLTALGCLSLDRAVRGRFDFHHFYVDARYVWLHGALNPEIELPPTEEHRQLPFYLPVVPLLLSPLAAFGRVPAALVWTAGQIAALAYSLRALQRWGEPRGFALAIVLAVPTFVEAARFNQLSYFVLALVLAGIAALEANKGWQAGALFGAASVLKLLPAIFLLWLVLKRRWSAVAAFVLTAVVLAIAPTVLAFGPQRTAEYHRQWYAYNVRGEAARGLLDPDLPEHFTDRRNQSIVQVLARLTWREHPHAAPLRLANLDPQAVQRLGTGIAVVLAAGLVWATRRGWEELTPERRRAEVAAYSLGMLVFSPLLRQYYLVWAFPAVMLLAREALGGETPGARRLGRAGLVLWACGMVAWIWPITRVYGAHLVMLILVGVLLLVGGAGCRASSAHHTGPVEEEPGRRLSLERGAGRGPSVDGSR